MTSKTKDLGLTRRTAYEIINGLEKRIRFMNFNGEWPYYIERAVIFGSYVNSDKPKISDIDIGLKISDRYERDQKVVEECAYDMLILEFPSYDRFNELPQEGLLRKTLVDLRGKSHYLSLHCIGIDDEAIFSAKIFEIPINKPFKLEELE